MAAPDLEIADAITAALNGEVWTIPFTADRLYVTDWDVKKELEFLQVGVWPADAAGELWERNRMAKNYQIGITFAQRVTRQTRAQLDDLLNLVTAVQEFLELAEVSTPTRGDFVNQGWDYSLRFDPNRLERHISGGTVLYSGLFASVITLDYMALT